MSETYCSSLKELRSLLVTVEKIADADIEWSDTYNLIFSDRLQGRIRILADELNVDIRYMDPDLGYEADVRAYVEMARTVGDILDDVLIALEK